MECVTQFGEAIPRRSEPDLIVEDEGVLVFIENKLSAGNRTTPSDPNNRKAYPTGCNGWWNSAFQSNSDFQRVAVESELYELMRHWLIGSHLAATLGKKFLLINIIRDEAARLENIESRFRPHIRESVSCRFIACTWEQLLQGIVAKRSDANAQRLMAYAAGKTIGYSRYGSGPRRVGNLKKAFPSLIGS